MLVLSRNAGTETYLYLPDGRCITLCVLKIHSAGLHVRLGIDAPPDVKVRRDDCKKME
jgi:sRNA-binding carbon storage regulator CsrA